MPLKNRHAEELMHVKFVMAESSPVNGVFGDWSRRVALQSEVIANCFIVHYTMLLVPGIVTLNLGVDFN
ncbi:hypothetical protein TNCV_1046581 [Trichonephila clavipes]|nr:hypothetical protein TNCV_1046581 [Trichonephila clavipes]